MAPKEQMTSESRLKMQKCFICDSAMRGRTIENICGGFKMKDDLLKVEELEVPKTTEIKSPHFDQWGFKVGSTSTVCMGEVVDLMKSSQDLTDKMTRAMIGGQVSKGICESYVKVLLHEAKRKKRLLASVSGETLKYESTCDAKDLESEEGARKCVDMWKQYSILHSNLFNTGGMIKEMYFGATQKFKSYGKLGSTVCHELNACIPENEDYVKSYQRSVAGELATEMEMAREHPDDTAPETVSQIVPPPGQLSKEVMKSLVKGFSWRKMENPTYGVAARGMATGS